MLYDSGDPLSLQKKVLAILGLPAAVRSGAVPPSRLLAEAVGHFELRRLPRGSDLRSATWQALANR